MPPGSIGGTYSGNAISCAAACASFDVLRDEKLLENALKRGEQLRGHLRKLGEKYPVREVRGLGLMNAIEFKPSPDGVLATPNICKIALADGLLLMSTSIFDTIRFMPPLTVSEQEVELGMQIFSGAVAKHFEGKKY